MRQTVGFLLFSVPLMAGGPKPKKPAAVQNSVASYLQRARAQNQDPQLSEGSLFRAGNAFGTLAPDYKARHVNDLIVIRVLEQTSSQAAGTVKSARNFSANSSLTKIPIGKVGAASNLQNLFSPKSSNALDGQAQTASSSQLNTALTGRVIEVLPNGVMVVEAIREVEMNNDRQSLVLRGLVRPGDVAADNSVFSTSLANLEIELKGKGVIHDGTRPPNAIVRGLLRLIGF